MNPRASVCVICDADFQQMTAGPLRKCCSDACYKVRAAQRQADMRRAAKDMDLHTSEVLESFERQVEHVTTGPHAGCWQWTGNLWGKPRSTNVTGRYARLYVPGACVTVYAHRWAFEQFNGPVPAGKVVDHMCHNEASWCRVSLGVLDCQHRRCVNPAHLVAASASENVFRGDRPNRSVTACPYGHPYDDENTYVHTLPSGRLRRHCKACTATRNRQYYAAKVGA